MELQQDTLRRCLSRSTARLWLQVLLRALRDFNLGKLTADDTGIFLGLLNDLFPKTAEQVPRAIDHAFEPKVWPETRQTPSFAAWRTVCRTCVHCSTGST